MRHDDKLARRGIEGVNSWLLTASGRKLTYLWPSVEDICIEDIAQCLSRLCRFTGATSQFYSVAQHSVLVGKLVKEMLDDECVDNQTVDYWNQIIAAMLHDAEEAYINDLAGPLKACMGGKYKWIGTGILQKVFLKFGVDWSYHNATVKAGDNKAILIERFYLMPDHPEWPKVAASEMEYAQPPLMEHDEARLVFLDTLNAALRVRAALLSESSAC